MPVQNFSQSMKASAARKASIAKTASAKIASATTAREGFIAKTDAFANRVAKAFKKNTAFEASQVAKLASTMGALRKQAAAHQSDAQGHLATSIRIASDNSEVVNQIESLATLRGKLAMLQTIANATLADDEMGEDDLLQIDDSGFVVDDDTNIMDDLPDTSEPTDDVATASRRQADDNGIAQTESDAAPVGTPQESTPETQSPVDAPVIARRRKAEDGTFSDTESDAAPVGTPEDDADDSADAPAGYSNDVMDTSAPTTTLSNRRKAADEDADADADLPFPGAAAPFTKEDGGNTARRRKAENGVDTDVPAEAGTVDENVAVASRRRKAEDAPVADEADEDDIDLTDDVMADDDAIMSADDDSTDPSVDPMDDDADDVSDADQFGLGDASDEDDAIAAAIFADEMGTDDLPSDEDDEVSDAPAVTASAARRSTAARTRGSAAHNEGTVLRSIMSDMIG